MLIKNHLTVSELAEYLGFTKGTIYKKVHQGILPAYKPFNKTLFFDKDKIDKIFRAKETYSALDAEIEANTYSITKIA
jgi:excisionase family DNA binding protein